jgi:hypothetical protein
MNYGGAFGDSSLRVLIDRDNDPYRREEETTIWHARLTLMRAGQELTLSGAWACGA